MYDRRVWCPSLVQKVLGIGITEEIDGPEKRGRTVILKCAQSTENTCKIPFGL